MQFKFTQNISCTESNKCSINLFEKLKVLLNTDDQKTFHFSISHEAGNHKIWVFLYDKNGKHEGEVSGKTVINNNSEIKKFTGKIPTLAQLKSKLV